MSRVSVNICREISAYIDEDVDLDVETIASGLSDADKVTLVTKLTGGCPPGLGDGDAARRHNIIERAYTAALNMPELPREIRDLFWLVHERAL